MTKPTNRGPAAHTPKTRAANQRTNYGETESWALIARVQNGDIEAFGVFYQRYHAEVFARVLRGNVDYHTAEDLTADVFTLLLRKIANRQGSLTNQGIDPAHYLYRMASNRLISHYRHRSHRAHATLSTDGGSFLLSPNVVAQWGKTTGSPVTANDYHYEVIDQDADPAEHPPDPKLIEALKRLAPRKRECVVLRIILDASERETAAIMGCKVGTVKSTLNRALRDLAGMLAAEGNNS